MKTERSRGQIAGWVFFGLATALLLVQVVSLYNRGSKGESDVGVFYRTARLLDEGAGGEVYEGRDSVTGWPIAIPPVGIAFFHHVSRLGPAVATFAWAAFNVLVAAGAVWALRRYFMQLGDARLVRAFPWMAGVFLVLASGSVQVGQYSLIFTTCWVLALLGSLSARPVVTAFMWALPCAVKVYPALMLAAPISQKVGRLKTALLLATALFILFFFVPMLVYGTRAWELNGSFIRNVVLDPSGRVNWMQALGTTANQSLDAVLIRYLSWYPKFHEQYTYVPTARFDLDTVRMLGHVLRLIVLGITTGHVVRFLRRGVADAAWSAMMMAALWSSTLYVMLPETRARYAVYAFLGFLPFALYVMQSQDGRQRAWRTAAFIVTLLLVLGFVPKQAEVWGVGFIGVLTLWILNLKWLRSLDRATQGGQ